MVFYNSFLHLGSILCIRLVFVLVVVLDVLALVEGMAFVVVVVWFLALVLEPQVVMVLVLVVVHGHFRLYIVI